MFKRLIGKNVLITGASSGIGEACAYQFAAAGANVILTARRQERLSDVQSKIESTWPSVKVHTATLDVRSAPGVQSVLAEIPSGLSSIDILVNNAGLALGVDPVDQLTDESIDAMIDTNIKGLLYVTRAVVRGMRERQSGHVIMIGSIAGLYGYMNGSVYCATKSAVHAISESLRAETIGVPIKVTEIKPGMVETEFSMVRYQGDKDKADAVYRGMEPMTADDVAETVVFAASRHQRCVVADVVLLANGQASATLAHRNPQKTCCGHIRGKLVILGVSLWLTSTIIAGVRRATGHTHNALGLPPPTSKQSKKRLDAQYQEFQESAAQRDQANQMFIDEAATPEDRKMREAFVESQERSRRMQEQWMMAAGGAREHWAGRRCHGGFMRWYLGIGERTFDWAVRRIERSSHFHKEEGGVVSGRDIMSRGGSGSATYPGETV
ncbi:hypothetical protein GGI07_000870 [Coemansia sp. Benny D115]|nr:hypothetical protein GGI07_000870 [Coemansia sp. Benny D115]